MNMYGKVRIYAGLYLKVQCILHGNVRYTYARASRWRYQDNFGGSVLSFHLMSIKC